MSISILLDVHPYNSVYTYEIHVNNLIISSMLFGLYPSFMNVSSKALSAISSMMSWISSCEISLILFLNVRFDDSGV